MKRFDGPVDTSSSPYGIMRPVPLSAVQLTDNFWAPRIEINRRITIPAQLKQCEETGRLDNFRRASGKKQIDFQGIYFNDSDIYKWLEAASFSLAGHPDPKLEAYVDAVIAEVAAAQQPDGYLNTYFMFELEDQRFTNLKDKHEIYCAGHLIQAAIAHHRATGKTTLLDIACRLADCLDNHFGPGKQIGACGHEEAEMALVELYRETREERYLTLAKLMIDARGQKPGLLGGDEYHQDHIPFSEQTEMVGHAVRHLYLCCGAADVAAETGDEKYFAALNKLWENFTRKRIYVTGGAGSRYEGEAFGLDYELPNDRAYTETCAAIGSFMWNWRMLQQTRDAQYADLMETTLYNAVLPGLSLDGTHYFYENPLADRGKHRRQEWFGCACCPPNVARLLASLPGYYYSVSDEAILVHLYASSIATIPISSGGEIMLSQKTNYPWDGEIGFEVLDAPEDTGECQQLSLRIPGWAELDSVRINGNSTFNHDIAGYAHIPMKWHKGEKVKLSLPMPIRQIECHPHVQNNTGRIALQRGPLIYCLEQADNPAADVWDIELLNYAEFTVEHHPELLGGVTVLKGEGTVRNMEDWDGSLYKLAQTDKVPFRVSEEKKIEITAIPYFLWANRDPGAMQVWIPLSSGD